MRTKKLLIGVLWGIMFTACGMPAEELEETEKLSASQHEFLSSPTKWTLTNNTVQALTFNCTCPAPYGLPYPIKMSTTTVNAGQSTIVSWTAFYNDGLGLNHCNNWNCSASTAGGAVYATTSFKTSWGQNITLTASTGGQLFMQ